MLIRSQVMQMFVQPGWGDGARKAWIYHCWIWEHILRLALTNHCGHIRQVFKSQRYCLMWLGFGLNGTPLIMRSITDAMMSQDQTIKSARSVYIDDICINENLILTVFVRKHLYNYGFVCKDPEQLEDSAKVLGSQVC